MNQHTNFLHTIFRKIPAYLFILIVSALFLTACNEEEGAISTPDFPPPCADESDCGGDDINDINGAGNTSGNAADIPYSADNPEEDDSTTTLTAENPSTSVAESAGEPGGLSASDESGQSPAVNEDPAVEPTLSEGIPVTVNPGPPLVTEILPDIFDNFAGDESLWNRQLHSPGNITFGNNNNTSANDGLGVEIVITGNPSRRPAELSGPTYANQVSTKEYLSFGTYSTRVKSAACLPNEEVITGVFVYSNDGEDLDSDGMIDNNEIDIEIACSIPQVVWLTVWTDYTNDSLFRKVTRRVNMTTGAVWQTRPGMEGSWGNYENLGNPIPDLPVAGFDATSQFYEMGFDWHADEVRFFMVVDSKKITLWAFDKSDFIPQNPASFMLNIWHSRGRWRDDRTGSFPSSDAILEADWFKYWSN